MLRWEMHFIYGSYTVLFCMVLDTVSHRIYPKRTLTEIPHQSAPLTVAVQTQQNPLCDVVTIDFPLVPQHTRKTTSILSQHFGILRLHLTRHY
jgi:hypothetical protein